MKFEHISAFDLDQTLIKCNSSFSFCMYLYKKKVFDWKTMLFCLKEAWLYKYFHKPLHCLHNNSFEKLFAGRNTQEIFKYVDEFVDICLSHKINSPLIEIFKKSQISNHYCLILSSSPEFLVKKFAEKLKCTNYFATIYNINHKNQFDSITQIIEGKKKAEILKQQATYLGINLKNTFAYSDSCDDIPFLEIAGKAIAVNPDKKLRSYSHKKAWPIIS